MTILTTIYLFLMALVLAVLDIQIEGKNGWAKNLSAWRQKELAERKKPKRLFLF